MMPPTKCSFLSLFNLANFPLPKFVCLKSKLVDKMIGIAKAAFSSLASLACAKTSSQTASPLLPAKKANTDGVYARLFKEAETVGPKQINPVMGAQGISTVNIEPIDQNAMNKLKQQKLEKLVQSNIAELKSKKAAFPADFRMELFKHILKSNPETPEAEPSKIIRMMFDFDVEYMQNSLKKWKTKTEEAQKALSKIQEYIAGQTLPEEMTFQQHAHLCYCLSALMSGTEIKDLDEVCDTQLHTMVKGVIHPEGKWTPRTVLEKQRHAKFIFHISKTGLTSIPQINYSIFRRNESEDSPFISVQIGAVACDESPEFDGVKDCGSRRALEHDFIHAGFALYAFEENPEKYWDRLKKVGMMAEHIRNDPELVEGSLLWKQVHAAFFMWRHELTTSIFVAGWPRGLPEKHWFLHYSYGSAPQILLRALTKFPIPLIPKLFSNEIETEQLLLKSVGCGLNGLNDSKMSDHGKVKEIMDTLNPGYEYLDKNFSYLYPRESTISVVWNRIKTRITTRLKM